ncbi:MAG: thioredoxin family protein [Kiritimatiellia bacterium]
MKKEILTLLVIVGAFALLQGLNFVKSPESRSGHHLIQTDDRNFYENMEASGDWVLLDFWAPWCPHCLKLKPAIRELAEENSETLRVLSVNQDEAPGLANQFRISGLPTLILLYKNREVDRRMGVLPKPVLADWVRGVKEETEKRAQ